MISKGCRDALLLRLWLIWLFLTTLLLAMALLSVASVPAAVIYWAFFNN